MIQAVQILAPDTWEEALALKAEHPEALPIAGGTDVMVELNFDRVRPVAMLDLTRVPELRQWGADDGARAAATDELRRRADAIARARDLRSAWTPMQDSAAVACSPRLAEALAEAVTAAGRRVVRLRSGAGHDAVAMSAVAPVAMLFVRCAGGISHHPAESVAAQDVAVAIEVLTGFLATTVSSDGGA